MPRRNTIVFLLTLSVCLLLGIGPVLAQLISTPTPFPPNASVIAQGVATLPAEQIAWRITLATTPPVSASARNLPGFIVGDQGVLLLNNTQAKQKTRLTPGEAAFVPAGAQVQETQLEAPLSYYRIDLVPPDQAANPGNDAEVFVGLPFDAPSGEHDIDLARDVLEADETIELPLDDQPAPVLLLVTAGQIGLVPAKNPSAEPVPLPAGQGVALNGAVTAQAGPDGASIVIAVIGPEPVPVATPTPVPTATPVPQLSSLTLQALACPAGYTGDQYGADCTEPIADVAFSIAGASTGASFSATTGGNGITGFADLPPDAYSISGGPSGAQAIICDAPSSDSTVTLDAGVNATCTWYAGAEGAAGEGEGTVSVSVHYCPSAPSDPFNECTAGDPSGAVVYGPVVTTIDASGQASGLPPGTYALQPGAIGAPQGYQLLEVRGSGGVTPDGWGFTIDEANPSAALQVIYVPIDGDGNAVNGDDGGDAGTGDDGGGQEGGPPPSAGGGPTADSDGDGLVNGRERRLGTDPGNPDTDGDGVSDGAEDEAGTNPLVSDSDTDEQPDVAPTASTEAPAAAPNAPAAAPGDADGDGLSDEQEAQIGTDPATADSDGDGLSDGAEVGLGAGAATGTDPTLADSDGDGVSDGDEISAGTNPLDPAA